MRWWRACRALQAVWIMGVLGMLLLIVYLDYVWHFKRSLSAITAQSSAEKHKEGEETMDEDSVFSLEQERRKQRILDVCAGADFQGRTNTLNQILTSQLKNLIIDEKHKIIYCYVPKVACTNWKKVMIILSQSLKSPTGKPYTNLEDIPEEDVHWPSSHLTFPQLQKKFGSRSLDIMTQMLQNYTKFLFVRNPFVRLISAFRNKFETPKQEFYKYWGMTILRRYGNYTYLPQKAHTAYAAGMKPLFLHFIQYLVDPQTERRRPFNEHWKQVYRLCYPCQIKYDFIGHLENLEKEAEYLLKILQLDRQVRFPTEHGTVTAESWMQAWYELIPISMRRSLYELYEGDFQLFGYSRPDSLLED